MSAIFISTRLPPLERAAALAAAIPVSGDSQIPWIAAELLKLAAAPAPPTRTERSRRWLLGVHRHPHPADLALSALVNSWSRLPSQLRTTATVTLRDRLLAAIPAAAAGTSAARLSAARLAGDLLLPAALEPILGLLPHADRPIAAAAESALLRLAAWAAGHEPAPSPRDAWPPTAPTPAHRVATRALATRAIESIEIHERDAVVLAAIHLLDPASLAWPARSTDPLVRWFAERDRPGHAALRSALRRATDPLSRARAWEWLGRESAGAAALDRIGHATSAAEHESLLSRGHLIASPTRRWRLGLIQLRDRGPSPLPRPADLDQLSPAARRWLPAVAAACRSTPALLERTLAPLLADPDPATRHAAVRTLPAPAIADYTFDPDPSVAHTAALRLIHHRAASPDLLQHLTRSPHPHLRRLAASELPDPWNPASERSRLEARRRLAADRHTFVSNLRARLAGPDRLSAILLARALNLEPEIELELLSLAAEPVTSPGDAHIQATAVAALGALSSPAATAALLACLNHPIDRVRANAVEASLRRRATPALRAAAAALTADPSHRVRANALRGTAEPDGLNSMLTDNRPLHRLAGLWAIERIAVGRAAAGPWDPLAARVAELARHDPEAPVRARAARCAAAMLARMRSGWTGRAVEVGAA